MILFNSKILLRPPTPLPPNPNPTLYHFPVSSMTSVLTSFIPNPLSVQWNDCSISRPKLGEGSWWRHLHTYLPTYLYLPSHRRHLPMLSPNPPIQIVPYIPTLSSPTLIETSSNFGFHFFFLSCAKFIVIICFVYLSLSLLLNLIMQYVEKDQRLQLRFLLTKPWQNFHLFILLSTKEWY